MEWFIFMANGIGSLPCFSHLITHTRLKQQETACLLFRQKKFRKEKGNIRTLFTCFSVSEFLNYSILKSDHEKVPDYIPPLSVLFSTVAASHRTVDREVSPSSI